MAATHWTHGGAGATTLARAVLDRLEQGSPTGVELLYPDELPLRDKIEAIATGLYGASGISVSSIAANQLDAFEKLGYGPSSGLHREDAVQLLRRPESQGRARRPRASGQGSATRRRRRICRRHLRDIMTMPGLPRRPAALDVGVDAQGQVTGL